MDFSIILVDDQAIRQHLLPLVAFRPISDLRVGILTIKEKWNCYFEGLHVRTEEYLQGKFSNSTSSTRNLIINSHVLPTNRLVESIKQLQSSQYLVDSDDNLIARFDDLDDPDFCNEKVIFSEEIFRIGYPEDIYLQNDVQISQDIRNLNVDLTKELPSGHNQFYGDQIYIGKNVQMIGASINSINGPVYIGDNVVIEEGTFLKGPVAIGDHSRVKTGAKIYPNVSVGPYCTVNGEINNTVIWGRTAKGHEGYLGCSVIGEGCNLGAGTTNSNLRNDWKNVKLYDYQDNVLRDTGRTKCGLIMGDFSMTAINTSFTTGTVIGACTQLATRNFVPKHVPDFVWMTDSKCEEYQFEKFLEMYRRAFASKFNVDESLDYSIFANHYKHTSVVRNEFLKHRI